MTAEQNTNMELAREEILTILRDRFPKSSDFYYKSRVLAAVIGSVLLEEKWETNYGLVKEYLKVFNDMVERPFLPDFSQEMLIDLQEEFNKFLGNQ